MADDPSVFYLVLRGGVRLGPRDTGKRHVRPC